MERTAASTSWSGAGACCSDRLCEEDRAMWPLREDPLRSLRVGGGGGVEEMGVGVGGGVGGEAG